jgi:hypothetical protein
MFLGAEMSDERFDRIEQRLDGLETGQTALRDEFRVRFDELGRHMRVRHEDVIARIAAIPEHTGPSKAEFDEHRQTIDRRVDTLESVVRQHSSEIAGLRRPTD